MHRKAVFSLAGVFLVVALVVPPIYLISQTQQAIDNIIIDQNNPGHETSGNITTTERVVGELESIYVIVVAVEAVFVVLFTITMYYGIKHIHPYH